MPPSSRLKNKPSKKPTWSRQQAEQRYSAPLKPENVCGSDTALLQADSDCHLLTILGPRKDVPWINSHPPLPTIPSTCYVPYCSVLPYIPLESSGHSVDSNVGTIVINFTIARTVLEDICDKPIRIQPYCAVARLHGVWKKETEDLLREIQWIKCGISARCRVAPTVQHCSPVIG
jgi:hypothetical protein